MSAAMPSALVIDDDAVLRITIADYLEEAGFVVFEAEDGPAGLAAFTANRPDIVLPDVSMPQMDGLMVCRKLRTMPTGEHAPILMVTGNDDSESVHQAFQAGATDFTSKSSNFELLVHRIRYMLRANQTADRLRQRETSLAYAQRIARLGNWEFNAETEQFSCSEALADIFGFTVNHELITYANLLAAVHADDRTRVEQNLNRSLDSGSTNHIEFRVVHADGNEIVVKQSTELTSTHDGGAVALVGAIQDITERRNAERRIRELAYYDTVTGLPNRVLLHEHLTRALVNAKRHNRSLGVLFVDLDHFKRINDTWGHTVGDELLRCVADRLTECIRQCDIVARQTYPNSIVPSEKNTVARLGGDEFVVLLTELRQPEDAAIVAQRIIAALSEPIRLQEVEVYVTGSVGISTYPTDGQDVETLLKQADGAMYEAKAEGRNGYHFYTKDTQARAFERLSLESELRRALEHEQFVLHYQPKIELESDRVVGLEALVRWNSPDSGLVSPADFIPVAEETGLIVPLGEWVLNQACAQTRAWCDRGFDGLRISVNLSAAQFRQNNLVGMVADALLLHRLEPDTLELELTESLLMNDVDAQTRLLRELRDIGVHLSIDDFGTGYSSLSYLKRFPINTLKIDRSFIGDMDVDEDNAAIVKGAIRLAQSLRLDVVAEGVENQRQLDLLRTYRCDQVQGYFFSRPLPAEDFLPWLTMREATPRLRSAS